MGNIVRTLSADGSVLCIASVTTDIINEVYKIHRTSPVVTAALGRTVTAAGIMGSLMKNQTDSLTLRIDGKGPCGALLAVSDYRGNVKAYAENGSADLPPDKDGKPNVVGIVGKNGFVRVIKDLGLKEPYIGHTPIISGEIAEDITSYYAVSEQIPTVCALGVSVNTDMTVKHAGGFLIQLLPFADDRAIDVIEKNIEDMKSVTNLLEMGLGAEDIALTGLKGLDADILDAWDMSYKCDCNARRIEKALISLGAGELKELANKQENVEVCCHFCNKKYVYTNKDIELMIK